MNTSPPNGSVKRVVIETIPHANQRYDTVGDWLYDAETGTVTIYVSEMGDWRMNMACGVHELVETLLCVQRGVDEPDVAAFDIEYEKARPLSVYDGPRKADCGCWVKEDSEPGEDAHAPYRAEHAVADVVERLFALEAGLVWADYNTAVYGLDWHEART